MIPTDSTVRGGSRANRGKAARLAGNRVSEQMRVTRHFVGGAEGLGEGMRPLCDELYASHMRTACVMMTPDLQRRSIAHADSLGCLCCANGAFTNIAVTKIVQIIRGFATAHEKSGILEALEVPSLFLPMSCHKPIN